MENNETWRHRLEKLGDYHETPDGDEYDAPSLAELEKFFAAELLSLADKIGAEKELHKHNSIPNYTDEAGDGCMTCDKNAALDTAISLIKEMVK